MSQEVVDHARDMTRLHAEYGELIISLARESTQGGGPINRYTVIKIYFSIHTSNTEFRPIWWLDPHDEVALGVDDEFLLGDQVLAAPVMEEGAVTRDVYLPSGTWRDGNNMEAESVTGPTWIRDYEAPLFVLPYFVKDD